MNEHIGEYAMKRLAEEAMKNFKKGIRAFRLFGKVNFRIEHMHDNEYAVQVYDVGRNEYVEILRLYENGNALNIA